jgi:hypothetical protein
MSACTCVNRAANHAPEMDIQCTPTASMAWGPKSGVGLRVCFLYITALVSTPYAQQSRVVKVANASVVSSADNFCTIITHAAETYIVRLEARGGRGVFFLGGFSFSFLLMDMAVYGWDSDPTIGD